MSELTEFTQELKEFMIERIGEIEERNAEIAAEKLNDETETKMIQLREDSKELSGELKGYTQIYNFLNEHGLI